MPKKMTKEEKEVIAGMKGLLAKMAREKLKATQREFAQLLGVHKKTVESWEQGLRPASGPVCAWFSFILWKPHTAKEALVRWNRKAPGWKN